jgi:hypothetical protein
MIPNFMAHYVALSWVAVSLFHGAVVEIVVHKIPDPRPPRGYK